MSAPSREVPIDPAHAALLIIDVQNYCARPESGKTEYFRRSLRDTVLPNIRRLQTTCRSGGIEVIYSVIENMTRDGRDRSLDYKISRIDVQCGSWEAHVVDEIAPAIALPASRRNGSMSMSTFRCCSASPCQSPSARSAIPRSRSTTRASSACLKSS
jgi:nicotinamidase-related amidase